MASLSSCNPPLDVRVQEAADWIRQQISLSPTSGIILGTGLGSLADSIEEATLIPYEVIPHFPVSTAPGHSGRLRCGMLAGMAVLAMEGRYHTYEGHSPAETAFPILVMQALGIKLLLISNAAGGMNPHFKAGDVVIVEDHLNFMHGGLPLLCDKPPKDLYAHPESAYDAELIEHAQQIARRAGFLAHRGVYIAVRGPNFETRAEYRFFRRIGGDVVGMSTVPEVLAAQSCQMRVLVLSTVTNVCLPDALKPTSGETVISTADQAASKVEQILLGILRQEASGR